MLFPKKDIQTVRALAQKIVELASSDLYHARKKRWRDVNERRKPDRAPVWCRPAGLWQELIPEESLECSDPVCRSVEYAFRQHLYKDWVGDDHIFEPWWGIPAAWRCNSEHVWGLPVGKQIASTDQGGFCYEHPVKSIEDYEKITVPTFTYDREATERELAHMSELLGDAMPVQLVCTPPLGPHQGIYLQQLRGMEQMLSDLAFHPEIVHRVMAKMTEGILGALRTAENTGLLTTNHHEPVVCSDPLHPDLLQKQVQLINLWGYSNSQEFQVVSPAMTEEFLLNYQIPVFQQYGAVMYGCCEDLTHKIDLILRIPNLRIFVSSFWTDLNKVIEACGKNYTIMWRQHAGNVVLTDDLASIREHLEQGLRKLQGHYYQIVLRELETLAGHPARLQEWSSIAIELAEKYA